MIYAVFQKQDSKIHACTLRGHAGFAEAGQDVVCAAVSSAVQFAANLITEHFQEQAEISVRENEICIALARTSGNGTAILEGLFSHLQCIAEEFPGCIRIES